MNKWLNIFLSFRERKSAVTVYLGKQTFNGFNPNQMIRYVKEVILHPNYNSTTKNNDIALLRLHSSVTFSDYVRPVCLAGQGSLFPDDAMSWITGWGNMNSTGKIQHKSMAPCTRSSLTVFSLEKRYNSKATDHEWCLRGNILDFSCSSVWIRMCLENTQTASRP